MGSLAVYGEEDVTSFRQALVRNLLRFVDGIFSYAVGLVVMLITSDCQRLGDLAAETHVVKARR